MFGLSQKERDDFVYRIHELEKHIISRDAEVQWLNIDINAKIDERAAKREAEIDSATANWKVAAISNEMERMQKLMETRLDASGEMVTKVLDAITKLTEKSLTPAAPGTVTVMPITHSPLPIGGVSVVK